MTLSNCMAFSSPTTHSGARFLHLAGLEKSLRSFAAAEFFTACNKNYPSLLITLPFIVLLMFVLLTLLTNVWNWVINIRKDSAMKELISDLQIIQDEVLRKRVEENRFTWKSFWYFNSPVISVSYSVGNVPGRIIYVRRKSRKLFS